MDSYPVSDGHALIIPYRHFSNYFDATDSERISIIQLMDQTKRAWEERFAPDGYNVGVNVGEAAGQTVPHLHVHLIPRYKGDVDDPRGGIRGVIPRKQRY